MDPHLTKLIERLEAAQGPDRELDAAIAVATMPVHMEGDYHKLPTPHDQCRSGTYWRCSRSGMALITAEEYTSSIDSALTLVPEGFAWEISRSVSGHFEAIVYAHDIHESFSHDTAAMSLCIAALRSRGEKTDGGR